MLKIGTFDQQVPAHTQLFVEGQNDFTIYVLDENLKPMAMIARSQERHAKFTIRAAANLRFTIEGKKFLSIDARPVQPDHETVSSIPYEIPDANAANLTLEEKLKRYLGEMVAERWGEDSAEMDTFDDAQDLNFEDDDPLARFDEITEEEIEPLPEPEPPAEPPAESPAEPPAEPPESNTST